MLLYPTGGEKEERMENAKMYNKTHGNYGPGEQKEREYQWPLDHHQHRFGHGEKKLLNGAAMSVHHERFESAY